MTYHIGTILLLIVFIWQANALTERCFGCEHLSSDFYAKACPKEKRVNTNCSGEVFGCYKKQVVMKNKHVHIQTGCLEINTLYLDPDSDFAGADLRFHSYDKTGNDTYLYVCTQNECNASPGLFGSIIVCGFLVFLTVLIGKK